MQRHSNPQRNWRQNLFRQCKCKARGAGNGGGLRKRCEYWHRIIGNDVLGKHGRNASGEIGVARIFRSDGVSSSASEASVSDAIPETIVPVPMETPASRNVTVPVGVPVAVVTVAVNVTIAPTAAGLLSTASVVVVAGRTTVNTSAEICPINSCEKLV